jgi:ABC-type multidrug transport system ATPase subunit
VLDEPTSGLDPYSQWAVRQTIAGLRAQGMTIYCYIKLLSDYSWPQ